MRRVTLVPAFSVLLAIVFTASVGVAQVCNFDIVGSWSPAEKTDSSLVYRFEPDGTLTVLPPSGGDGEPLATAKYKLEDAPTYKKIELTVLQGGEIFAGAKHTIAIRDISADSFTSFQSEGESIRWMKSGPAQPAPVDPFRYFVVFAARQPTAREDRPVLVMLVKTDGREESVETVGYYQVNGRRSIDRIPESVYREIVDGPDSESQVSLRVEVGAAEFARALKVVQTWQRRGQEGALLYPLGSRRDMGMNTSVILKQVAESIKGCGDPLQLYRLDWQMNDELANNYRQWQLPFQYVKRLKKMNELLHVGDEAFQAARQPVRRSDAR